MMLKEIGPHFSIDQIPLIDIKPNTTIKLLNAG
jgi:hypothetical protein